MIERPLPAILELAARNEDDIGILEPGHIAAEVPAVPRGLHAGDGRQDGGAVAFRGRVGGRCKGNERERQQGSHRWNCPTMTVWHWPPSSTRSPSSRQLRKPVRLLAWSAVNSFRPSFFAQ